MEKYSTSGLAKNKCNDRKKVWRYAKDFGIGGETDNKTLILKTNSQNRFLEKTVYKIVLLFNEFHG